MKAFSLRFRTHDRAVAVISGDEIDRARNDGKVDLSMYVGYEQLFAGGELCAARQSPGVSEHALLPALQPSK